LGRKYKKTSVWDIIMCKRGGEIKTKWKKWRLFSTSSDLYSYSHLSDDSSTTTLPDLKSGKGAGHLERLYPKVRPPLTMI
jgi:hypothetical protein